MNATADTRTPADTMIAYFDAWRDRDAEAIRPLLAADVVFDGPMGHVEGLEDNIASLHGLLSVVTDVEVLRVLVDGPDVVTIYRLHTSVAEPMTTVNWSHVVDGRATAIRAVFDPRPMLSS